MAERIVDDNGIIDFIDDNGEACFIDDAGNFTCGDGGGGGGGGATMPTPIIAQSVLRRVPRLRRRRRSQ